MSKVIVDEIQTDTTNGNVRVIPNGTGVLEVKGAGGDDAMLQLNCSAQSHGVKIKSPAHSAGQSYTMILPDNQIAADKYLKVKSITGSGATAVGQLEFADVSGGSGISSDAQYNTVGGTNAGGNFSGTDVTNATIYGYEAGGMTTADDVVAIGYQAGKDNNGFRNTIIGSQALSVASSTGNRCVAVGYQALKNCDGDYNTAIGADSGKAITTGYSNTCVGYQSGNSVTTGYDNVFIGYRAGLATTEARDNVVIGHDSFLVNTTGNFNVAVSASCMQNNTSGQSNSAVGYLALYDNIDGDKNSALGRNALKDVTTGGNNTGIGYRAGESVSPSGSITTGSNNIVLGNNDITNLYCADTTISSSDSRDKTDITNFTIGLNWIEALRPVTYRWDRRTWYGTDEEPYGTPDGSKKRQRLHVGFLAQEALAVEQANGYGTNNNDSLAVHLNEDGMSYGIKYERLVPILVNAIKELSTRVKTLEGG